MAETKSTDEPPTLPAKRKPDFCVKDEEDHPNNKNSKLEKPLDKDSLEEKSQNQTLVSSVNNKLESEEDEEERECEGEEEGEEEEGDEGDAEVTEWKGKRVMKDDKGKGKALAEEDSSDDEDSSEGGIESGDSDLSDDPLAEVDLDNILPSRTRRKSVQPGAYVANDHGADDDDDSDDSDA